MATARAIIQNALTFYLNRLSPGETMDADLAAVALAALNDVNDEVNGGTELLFRDLLTPGTVSGITGTLGTTWAGLTQGNTIFGATVSVGSVDIVLAPITIAQYQQLSVKATSGQPRYYAYDESLTVYFYPAPATPYTVTLLTRQSVSDFADLDTVYALPSGYQSFYAAMVAERLAPSMLGGVTPTIAKAAQQARARIYGGNLRPGIIGRTRIAFNILTGNR